jgi:hypothetical protein
MLVQLISRLESNIVELTGVPLVSSCSGPSSSLVTPSVSLRWRKEVMLANIMNLVALTLWIVTDVLRYSYRHPSTSSDIWRLTPTHQVGLFYSTDTVAVSAVGAQLFTMILTHLVAGPRLHKQYRVYQPFMGGIPRSGGGSISDLFTTWIHLCQDGYSV